MMLNFFALLLLFSTVLLTSPLPNSPLVPIFGSCQKLCVKKFATVSERITNTDVKYTEVDVTNNTDFSLCKLGCNSPEYNDLQLPAFQFGQSAYQEVLAVSEVAPNRMNVVTDISILCLDSLVQQKDNSSSKRQLTGKLLLSLDNEVKASDNVYFVEIVAQNADNDDVDDNNIVYQDWCYSSNCNATFTIPTKMANLEVRLRVSTFDENGPVGGVVLSRWYNINHILAHSSVDMQLDKVEWNEDKAAAKFTLGQTNSITIPVCSMEMLYKSSLSSEFRKHSFSLDFTRQVLIKKLDFDNTYSVRLVPASKINHIFATMAFEVPTCREMVHDMSMCAPPPVTGLDSHWNHTSSTGYGLTISWSYVTDKVNQSVLDTNSKISMSHFMFILNPLITPNNEKCQKYEPIRRDVTWTHRKVVFYVPDAECNYEAEVSAFDTKQRKSETRKMKISRINEPSYMSLLLANDIPASIGFGALILGSFLILSMIVILFLHRRKQKDKKVEELNYVASERMVYAYVDATDASRTVIGVRPISAKYDNYGLGGLDTSNETHPYYTFKHPQLQLRVQPNGTAESTSSFTDDHAYETIDYHHDSDLSDDVFIKDGMPSPTSSTDSVFVESNTVPMMAFGCYDKYDFVRSYLLSDFQHRKTYEPEGPSYWRTTTVVDMLRGTTFSLKHSRDFSKQTREALQKELAILKTMSFQKNMVRLEGLAIGNFNSSPYQIVGMLMENCQGGSLRRYIQTVGSVLRRLAITPTVPEKTETLQLRIESSPSPPSSGYDSFASTERISPEKHRDHMLTSMSVRFCQFSEQIASALEHLHCLGIIHTRVTTISVYLYREYFDPLDVLCDQYVKLGDFGNASRSAHDVKIDQNLQPPEVVLGKKYEAKGDIWQFGTCLVEMCTLGLAYQVQKEIPASGLDDFDKLPSTRVIRDAAKKCLNSRHRPSASDLRGVFQTDTAREIKALDMAQMNQSLMV